MSADVRKATYVVTGAAGGIGKAIVAKLIEQGATGLFLVDRDASQLAILADTLSGSGVQVETQVTDVSDPAALHALGTAVRSAFPRLSGAVSNAGIIRPGALCETPLETYEEVFAVNTRATWLLAKELAEPLTAGKGALIAISSISASHAVPGVGLYSASKAALVALCRQLALEWSERGVRVNCVAPGTTETSMTSTGLASSDIRAARESMIPSRRVGQPVDIAEVVAFLLSPAAEFVNGVDWAVDGGQGIALFHGRASVARH